jgi:hypothetical protein
VSSSVADGAGMGTVTTSPAPISTTVRATALGRGALKVDRDGIDGGVEPELAENLDAARPDAGGARVDRRPGPAFDEHCGDPVVGEQRGPQGCSAWPRRSSNLVGRRCTVSPLRYRACRPAASASRPRRAGAVLAVFAMSRQRVDQPCRGDTC